MPDPADLGNAAADAELARALSRQLGRSAPESHPEFDGGSCVDCGNDIPLARLQMKRVRCVECQAALESRIRQGVA